MKFSVDLDIYGALKLTNAIAKQIPFAMAKALTQTAIQAQTDIVQAMAQVYGVDGKTLVVRGSHPDFAYITNKWGNSSRKQWKSSTSRLMRSNWRPTDYEETSQESHIATAVPA